MRQHVKIEVTAGTLAAMTVEQFEALQKNVLADGVWDHVDQPVHLSGTSYLGVQMPDGLFIGIEKDGYTHT